MKTTTTLMTAILAALVLGEAAQADPVVIGNPSFEAPVVGPNLRGFDSPTTEVTLADWSIRDDNTIVRSAYLDGRTTTVPQPTDGVQMVLLGYSGNGNSMAI